MEPWGVHHRVVFIGQHEEDGTPSDTSRGEESNDEEETVVKIEPVSVPEIKKRKRLSLSQLKEVKEESCEKQSSSKLKKKKHESRDRWSADRYKLAEQNMWEVLKAEGATFENPITRPALRLAARKHIGDTGLLDHLLKHIDGKVAPGGTDRFRRWFNTNGIMEYWLESAELEKVRQEAGVRDPYWLPDSSGELKQLKIELAQMKNRDMQELIGKKEEKNDINSMEETHKDFVKWKAMTDHRLTEIMTSLKGVQVSKEGKYGELVIWKTKVEQQLVEITSKLNDLQASRECTTLSPPSERWKDWIESTNLDNIQEDAFATWIGNPELLNVPEEIVLEEPSTAIPTQPSNEELTNKKSDVLELVQPVKQEDQPNVTPDSSTTVNSKSDLDNSLIMFQEMFVDLYKWKEKMEQQLMEVSNTVYGMLAMK
ncbi:protein DYAD isoform X1 [Cajanus cajan]|uniref:protein DYAD isoform X1 n=1 Tax=Cajanus cajan TaxID=3821 RepID=UPI00098DC988|nr:protein DYAD isoform X1 [Cajanus cajan]XP_020213043.1 protein DYAD isoform X1 [Cajanus cajan]XP_020213044.1 protein DYAD isoform X1 [Cajanus cajan]